MKQSLDSFSNEINSYNIVDEYGYLTRRWEDKEKKRWIRKCAFELSISWSTTKKKIILFVPQEKWNQLLL